LAFALAKAVQAEDSPLDGLEDTYGNEKMLSIATGHLAPQNLSPSVTSILTSKDIENIGARRVQDVLEYLPGIHVSSARSGNAVFGFRGIYSETNSQVLLLVNGTPIRDTIIGGKPLDWTMPIKSISRIEVIRGPGSMLYGGDATTGVINVVTKTGKELKGGNVGGFFGSHDTYEGWAQYGQKTDDWEYSLSTQVGATNGSQGRIERDAQSLIDKLFGTKVSHAPGFTNNGREDFDVRVDVAYKEWLRFRAGYQGFTNVQTNEGVALALDNTGTNNLDIYNTDLSIKQTITDNLGFDSKFYFLGQDTNLVNQLLPPGTLGGLLPKGAVSQAANFQGTSGWANQFIYNGFNKHNITLGTGIIHNWVTNVSNKLIDTAL
jgi:outer membrane cobalamin receptor